jgi:quercetin dioxygenase-like cupin family protein
MPETIRFKDLELRFLQSKEDTGGSLDVFEMTVQPNARVPVPHHHESWDETIHGLVGVTTWRVDGHDIMVGPGQTAFIKRGIVHGFRNDAQQPTTCLMLRLGWCRLHGLKSASHSLPTPSMHEPQI